MCAPDIMPSTLRGTSAPLPSYTTNTSAEVTMFCDRCGANLTPASRFCPTCGKSFAPVAQPQAPEYRVSRHVRNLGILWMVYSAIHLIPGLILQSMPHWLPFRYDYPFFLGGIFRAIGAMLMLKGVLGLIAGWGLLDRQPGHGSGGTGEPRPPDPTRTSGGAGRQPLYGTSTTGPCQ